MKPPDFPPAYVALIERLVELIEQWCGEQPSLPDLQWHDPGDTAFIGGLGGEARKFLAKSPDAMTLLAWLDEQTGRQATLIQVTIALRMLGHLPGGPPQDVVKTSEAMRGLEAFAFEKGTDTRLPVTPCPECGKGLDAASGLEGHTPNVGDLSICCYCCAFLCFDEGLTLRALPTAELVELPADVQAQLAETRDLFRAAKMGRLKHGVKA